tara:strand:+ start:244 stop:408 length:165 start_codon:yes stop_codon:yes gene_type:complete
MTNQMKIYKEQERKRLERMKTFSEIQSSKNPLTKEEIEKLAEKNPKTWSVFNKQ